MLDELTIEDFAPHEGSVFTAIPHEHEPLELTLERVIDKSEKMRVPEELGLRKAFTLVFRGPAGTKINEGLLPFEHPEIGAFAVHVIPLSGATPERGGEYAVYFS